MGRIKEFVDTQKAELEEQSRKREEQSRKNQYWRSALQAGEKAIKLATDSGQLAGVGTLTASRRIEAMTPLVTLEDGSRVAVAKVQEHRDIAVKVTGYDLVVPITDNGYIKTYVSALAELGPGALKFSDSNIHKDGYDESADIEAVAAYQTVADVMERTALAQSYSRIN